LADNAYCRNPVPALWLHPNAACSIRPLSQVANDNVLVTPSWRKYLNPLELFRFQPPSAPGDDLAELGQAHVRFAIAILASTYAWGASYLITGNLLPAPWAAGMLVCFGIHILLASITYAFIKRWPGHYPARRIFVMLLDTVMLVVGIALNHNVMLPLYAVIVWSLVGHGLRYGRNYLIIGTVVGQIALLTLYIAGPFVMIEWSMAATLSLTAFAVPIYAWVLLRRVEAARADAEAMSLSKSRFLAQASHDLRQPLHATSLFIGRLRGLGLSGEQAVVVDRIERSIAGVSNLFRSLLDVSMLDSGRLVSRIEVVALGPFLADLVAENSVAAGWASVRIRHVRSGRHVLTDAALLRSMVQNLISNAIKYSEGNDILIGTRLCRGEVAIEVWDRGPGIPAEALEHVFQEFYQYRRPNDADRPGVGLGLAIVKRLADMLALDIDITSRPGRGTRAAITGLPPATGTRAATAAVRPMLNLRHPLTGLRILLIEDDRDVLDATMEMLERWGCVVDAHLAVPARIEARYDLLITDFDLGLGLSGADAIMRYRAVVGPDAPVLVVTGHDHGLIGTMVPDHGVMLVKKPVALAELRSILSAVRLGAVLPDRRPEMTVPMPGTAPSFAPPPIPR
jgi:signal transduction histidine kinase